MHKLNNVTHFQVAVPYKYLMNCPPNYKIFLNHYLHKVWPLSHYGSWHLFGHSHGTMNEYAAKEGKLLDVGVDSHNFTPWSLDEVVEVMKTRPDNFNLVKVSNIFFPFNLPLDAKSGRDKDKNE